MDVKMNKLARALSGLHSLSSNIRGYALVLFLMTGYAAWSVYSSIDQLLVSKQLQVPAIDGWGLKIFGAGAVFAFGWLILKQYFVLRQRLEHLNDAGEAKGDISSKPKHKIPKVGLWISVSLMLVAEIAARASVFFTNGFNVSAATWMVVTFVTLFFSIPLFLGPSMTIVGEEARRMAQAEKYRIQEEQVTQATLDRVMEARLKAIKSMPDDEVLEKYGGLLAPRIQRIDEVEGTIQQLTTTGDVLQIESASQRKARKALGDDVSRGEITGNLQNAHTTKELPVIDHADFIETRSDTEEVPSLFNPIPINSEERRQAALLLNINQLTAQLLEMKEQKHRGQAR